MQSRFGSFAKQTLIYGVSGAAIQALGLITLPIYSRVFEPAEYGVLEITTVSFSIMLTLAEMGMVSAAQRSFFDYEDEAQRRRVLVTGMLTASAAAAAIAATVVVAREPLSDWLYDGSDYTNLLVIAAVTVPIANFAFITREIMRLRFRAWHYALSAGGAAIAGTTYGVVAVVAFDEGLEAILVGTLIGHSVACLYGGAIARRDLRARFDTRELRVMLRYAIPLIPAALSLWALSFIDRIMLARLSSLDEVGQYAVATRVASVLMLGVTALHLALGPWMLDLYSRDRELEKDVRARMMRYVAVVFAVVGLTLALFARELIAILAPDYDRAYEAAGLVLLGVGIYSLAAVAQTGITYVRRTTVIAAGAVGAAAFNIALNFALIPELGQVGAGIATALAYAGMAVTYYVTSQRLYPTPFEPAKIVAIVLLATAVGTVGTIPIEPLGLALAVKTLALGAFLLALIAMRAVSYPELLRLRELAAGYVRQQRA